VIKEAMEEHDPIAGFRSPFFLCPPVDDSLVSTYAREES
jgi:hypothetical protein